MDRRQFLTSTLVTSALSGVTAANAQEDSAHPQQREYYELRRYQFESGQQKQADVYFSEALIPALNRLGMKPIGAFNLDIGVQTPAVYLLIPSTSVEKLVTVETGLARDSQYLRTGERFLNATAKEPPYVSVDSSLMIAFEGWPKLTAPPASAQNGSRVFQLRTYESPSWQDHKRKVEMFHSGEFEIFRRAGFWEVFYGDTLIGSRLPNLTYMVGFPDLAELNEHWDKFRSDPEWQKLTHSPRFDFDQIVTNVTNLVVKPASYSQI